MPSDQTHDSLRLAMGYGQVIVDIPFQFLFLYLTRLSQILLTQQTSEKKQKTPRKTGKP